MRRAGQFKAFGEGRLQEYLDRGYQQLQARITAESEDYILNVNEADYIPYIVDMFFVEPPIIDFDGLSASQQERMVPAEQFPSTFNVYEGKSYPRPVVVFHLPVSGNTDLLSYRPDRWYDYSPPVYLSGGDLCIEQVVFSQTPQQIRDSFNQDLRYLRSNYDSLVAQIEGHNQRLRQSAEETFRARKRQFLERNQMLAAIGVPIKKRQGLPETFAIPAPQNRKRVAPRPSVSEKGFTPDPTLDAQTYQDILQTIHDVGKVFERLPATYRDKDEEALRDHLLLYLEPRYEGAASGETFNKAGKTDILIRYQNSNIFVAECKFWSGPKSYLGTIDQLLGNLVWRDAKAAAIIFVRNKDISSVIRAVQESTPSYPNFVRFVNEVDDSWLNYVVHINDDPNRHVRLAVLLFHIPS